MSSWWRRWAVLVGTPCLIVWIWCAVPFPVDNPYTEEPPWRESRFLRLLTHLAYVRVVADIPWPGDPPSTALATSTPASSAVAAPIDSVLASSATNNLRYERDVKTLRPLLLEILNTAPTPTSSYSPVVAPPADEPDLPVDANWWFFLLYCASPRFRGVSSPLTSTSDTPQLPWARVHFFAPLPATLHSSR